MPTPHHRILIVEDDNAVQKVPVSALLRKGHTSTLVSTLQGALRELDSGNFDVVLLDPSLPDVVGLEALEILRRFCPVIVVTGMEVSEEDTGTLTLRKPLTGADLLSALALVDVVHQSERLILTAESALNFCWESYATRYAG